MAGGDGYESKEAGADGMFKPVRLRPHGGRDSLRQLRPISQDLDFRAIALGLISMAKFNYVDFCIQETECVSSSGQDGESNHLFLRIKGSKR